MSERAYRRCPDGDRPAIEPGGVECQQCGCIFIGSEWHGLCAVCLASVDRSAERQDAAGGLIGEADESAVLSDSEADAHTSPSSPKEP